MLFISLFAGLDIKVETTLFASYLKKVYCLLTLLLKRVQYNNYDELLDTINKNKVLNYLLTCVS